MKTMCPISLTSVNERVAQINAALTVVVLLLFLVTPYKWLIVILGIDFFIRAFLNPAHSYLAAVGRAIVRWFGIRPIMVNAGPKIFAARIGFLFCCILALLEFFGYHSAGVVIGMIFAFFAGMEALFRLCIACKMYPLIHRMKRSAEG